MERTAGSLFPKRVFSVSVYAAVCSRAETCERIRLRLSHERPKEKVGNMAECVEISTIRAESLYGRGRRMTALTILKMAVLALMPRARVTAAAKVKPGFLRSMRTA